MSESFAIALTAESTVTGRYYAPDKPELPALFVLAHGAGAGQDHPFMTAAARGFAARGLATATFNFLYMERRSGAPNPAPQLEACYRAAVATIRDRGWLEGRRLVLGGKSMGGRMASHLGADPGTLVAPIAALVFLGYPLRPPGRPDKIRAAHLSSITAPMLFVQGTRDAFGTPDELAPFLTGLPATVLAIDKADHSFKVSSVRDKQALVFEKILDDVVAWIATTCRRG
jgi:predicted alpha/beta-hydrolase family hydrolase